jgi:hypothetical protein
MRHLVRYVMLVLICSAPARAHEISIADIDGKMQRPFASGKKAIVLIFVLPDCPIANAFAPEIKRICKEYEAKGAALFLVHVEPTITATDAKKHAADFGYECSVLLDSKHELVKLAQATMTPEAALFSADAKLLYHGRINNLYADLGKKRPEATHHDLREALDAVLSGKPVHQPVTEAIGCFIPALEGEKK